MTAPADALIACLTPSDGVPEHHFIDRRKLIAEKDPNDARRPELKDRQNQTCVCGKINGSAAGYFGGSFEYVYLAPTAAAKGKL